MTKSSACRCTPVAEGMGADLIPDSIWKEDFDREDDELHAYMRNFIIYTQMDTPEKFTPLFFQYKYGSPTQSERSKKLIIFGSARVVLYFVRLHARPSVPLVDLMQKVMLEALPQALDSFDLEQGIPFHAHAAPVIITCIHDANAKLADDPAAETASLEAAVNHTISDQLQIAQEKAQLIRTLLLNRASGTGPRDAAITIVRLDLGGHGQPTIRHIAELIGLSSTAVNSIINRNLAWLSPRTGLSPDEIKELGKRIRQLQALTK